MFIRHSADPLPLRLTTARSLARLAVIPTLLLAAVALAADASEYPQLGAPGLRVFAVTALPLLVAGLLTLAAARSDAETGDAGLHRVRVIALVFNVGLLVWSAPALLRGMPSFFILRPLLAALLVAAATALVTARR